MPQHYVDLFVAKYNKSRKMLEYLEFSLELITIKRFIHPPMSDHVTLNVRKINK